MTTEKKMRVVAIEEHYWDRELAESFGGTQSALRTPEIVERLFDCGELRIKEMDEAGIDVQVLSHGAPSAQRLDPASAVRLAPPAHDRLHEVVRARPNRFAAFATLPTADPVAAADELERSVAELGFKGAMVHGQTNGLFLDDRRFWPIFERAEALDVPLYLHPAAPLAEVAEAYYKDYAKDYPGLLAAGWGYTVECGTQAIRLVLSGVLDAFPRTKIILGHLGETIPFALWRIDQALSRQGNRYTSFSFRDCFCRHFWLTTSGNFSTPALLCCLMEMGIDRILFAVDYPFVPNKPGMEWALNVPLCAEDKEKLLGGNAARLLGV
jgi:predicted TIM-barrel fold metal-dependent hydrolase